MKQKKDHILLLLLLTAGLLAGCAADDIQTDGKPMVLKLTNCGSVTAENCSVERHTEEIKSIGVN